MIKSFVLGQRPIRIFDAANAEHRDLYYKFTKTKSWKSCPYQWVIDDDSVDVVYNMSKKLLKYYTDSEFVVKKPRKTGYKKVLKIDDLQSRKKATK
jgi:hypothetical protein